MPNRILAIILSVTIVAGSLGARSVQATESESGAVVTTEAAEIDVTPEVTVEATEKTAVEASTKETTEETVVEEATKETTEEVIVEESTKATTEETIVEEPGKETTEETVVEEPAKETTEETIVEETTKKTEETSTKATTEETESKETTQVSDGEDDLYGEDAEYAAFLEELDRFYSLADEDAASGDVVDSNDGIMLTGINHLEPKPSTRSNIVYVTNAASDVSDGNVTYSVQMFAPNSSSGNGFLNIYNTIEFTNISADEFTLNADDIKVYAVYNKTGQRLTMPVGLTYHVEVGEVERLKDDSGNETGGRVSVAIKGDQNFSITELYSMLVMIPVHYGAVIGGTGTASATSTAYATYQDGARTTNTETITHNIYTDVLMSVTGEAMEDNSKLRWEILFNRDRKKLAKESEAVELSAFMNDQTIDWSTAGCIIWDYDTADKLAPTVGTYSGGSYTIQSGHYYKIIFYKGISFESGETDKEFTLRFGLGSFSATGKVTVTAPEAETTSVTVQADWRDAYGETLTEDLPESVHIKLYRTTTEPAADTNADVDTQDAAAEEAVADRPDDTEAIDDASVVEDTEDTEREVLLQPLSDNPANEDENRELVLETDLTPDEQGNWTYTWSDLPKADSNGQTYYYSVEQDEVTGYVTTYGNNKGISTGTITITNTAISDDLQTETSYKITDTGKAELTVRVTTQNGTGANDVYIADLLEYYNLTKENVTISQADIKVELIEDGETYSVSSDYYSVELETAVDSKDDEGVYGGYQYLYIDDLPALSKGATYVVTIPFTYSGLPIGDDGTVSMYNQALSYTEYAQSDTATSEGDLYQAFLSVKADLPIEDGDLEWGITINPEYLTYALEDKQFSISAALDKTSIALADQMDLVIARYDADGNEVITSGNGSAYEGTDGKLEDGHIWLKSGYCYVISYYTDCEVAADEEHTFVTDVTLTADNGSGTYKTTGDYRVIGTEVEPTTITVTKLWQTADGAAQTIDLPERLHIYLYRTTTAPKKSSSEGSGEGSSEGSTEGSSESSGEGSSEGSSEGSGEGSSEESGDKEYDENLQLYDEFDLTADTEGNWTTTWDDLPKTNANGDKYYYSVEEETVSGYTVSYTNNDGINEGTITVTNRLEASDGDISVKMTSGTYDASSGQFSCTTEITTQSGTGGNSVGTTTTMTLVGVSKDKLAKMSEEELRKNLKGKLKNPDGTEMELDTSKVSIKMDAITDAVDAAGKVIGSQLVVTVASAPAVAAGATLVISWDFVLPLAAITAGLATVFGVIKACFSSASSGKTIWSQPDRYEVPLRNDFIDASGEFSEDQEEITWTINLNPNGQDLYDQYENFKISAKFNRALEKLYAKSKVKIYRKDPSGLTQTYGEGSSYEGPDGQLDSEDGIKLQTRVPYVISIPTTIDWKELEEIITSIDVAIRSTDRSVTQTTTKTETTKRKQYRTVNVEVQKYWLNNDGTPKTTDLPDKITVELYECATLDGAWTLQGTYDVTAANNWHRTLIQYTIETTEQPEKYYKIKEKKLDGYDDPEYVNNPVAEGTIIVTNKEKIEGELPETGYDGSLPPIVWGMMFVGSAALLYSIYDTQRTILRKRRRRVQRSKDRDRH